MSTRGKALNWDAFDRLGIHEWGTSTSTYLRLPLRRNNVDDACGGVFVKVSLPMPYIPARRCLRLVGFPSLNLCTIHSVYGVLARDQVESGLCPHILAI